MPQIDIAASADPRSGHIKSHFWVNGAGAVTWEQGVAPRFDTVAEQDAERGYIQALTFSVPQTSECSRRELELVGDFFVAQEATEPWATFVRLSRRNVSDAAGALRRSDWLSLNTGRGDAVSRFIGGEPRIAIRAQDPVARCRRTGIAPSTPLPHHTVAGVAPVRRY